MVHLLTLMEDYTSCINHKIREILFIMKFKKIICFNFINGGFVNDRNKKNIFASFRKR